MTNMCEYVIKVKDIPSQCDFKTNAHYTCEGDGIPKHILVMDDMSYTILCDGCFNRDVPEDDTDYEALIARSWRDHYDYS